MIEVLQRVYVYLLVHIYISTVYPTMLAFSSYMILSFKRSIPPLSSQSRAVQIYRVHLRFINFP